MRTLYESAPRKRVKILVPIFGFWFLVIIGRLVEFQLFEHGRLKAEARQQTRDEVEVWARRGSILDRNGRTLATSLPASSVYLQPGEDETVEENVDKVRRLGTLLGLTDAEEARAIKQVRNGADFIYIKKRADPEVEGAVKKLGFDGIGFEPTTVRAYPQGTLAAHVLGWLNDEGKGGAGLEYAFDDLLAGKPGSQVILRDARGRRFETQTLLEAQPGEDLVLNLDSTIQYRAEVELERGLRESGGTWGTVVVMSPDGEVLALANRPAYDPNNGAPEKQELWRNIAIKFNFEPGSTFKIVTVAAAVENGRVGFDQTFDCREGSLVAGGTVISDHKRFGLLSFAEVFSESSNVGTALVARRLGPRVLYDEILKFGFGQRTGIEFAAEEAGLVHPLERWNKKSSLEHVAIGYEVMATAAQVLQAINVFATRGRLVRPRIVQIPATTERTAGLPAERQILDSRPVEEIVRRVLTRVVEEGTGLPARLDGFTVAGKTGTAQKNLGAGLGYSSTEHQASFAGFVPAEDPVFSMVVIIDSPRGELQYGGQVAAPIFRRIAEAILQYLRIPPRPRAGTEPILVEPAIEERP
jgi:cell division protein FtsI (penicillin-binding protein 3)